MLTIFNFLNAHNLPIFQPILMILVSKFMVHRALSDKTYLSLGLLSPLMILLHGLILLPDATSYDNMLLNVTLVTGKLNFLSFSLLLYRCFPNGPKMPCRYKNIYATYVKGIFDLGGTRFCQPKVTSHICQTYTAWFVILLRINTEQQ